MGFFNSKQEKPFIDAEYRRFLEEMAELMLAMPDSPETMSAEEINSQPQVKAYWIWLAKQSLVHRENPFTGHWHQKIMEKRKELIQEKEQNGI